MGYGSFTTAKQHIAYPDYRDFSLGAIIGFVVLAAVS